ncbi:acyl-CoA dehydrogenase [Mycobacterium sp. GA-1199]|uniref:acyl-CoA dehydrogenase family protein n=1 Tax=Mycobacterium sp. GA-1199 TaxID=1772287 RepID=UPI0007471A2A|nr:acyl-CoA dehydrogenase family protein [Mycobacterium sp. GA-1199]KUI44808.1 acyl-CoA dehydrogenase [Mycobacterium sp. GA-1199]
MRVIPSQDERDLAAMSRSVLAAESEPKSQWKALTDAGVFAMPLDGALTDIGVFCVEAGRALCPRIVQNTLYSTIALDSFGACSNWLPRLTSGEAHGTCALFDPRDASDVSPRLHAWRDGDRWLVRGVVDHVADADAADVLVASTDLGVVAVDTAASGVSIEPLALMGGFPASTVRLDEVAVDEPMSTGDDELRRVANIVVALDCLDLVGIGEAVIDRTVDYTKMREQFGKPIAAFQAAQHLVADMHISLAAARLAAHSAVFHLGKGRTATRETAIARIRGAEIKKITLDAHQLHGGMGYVVDTGLHRFSERARILSTLGGGADIAARWLAAEMGWEGVR